MKKVFVLVLALVALSIGGIYAYNRNGGHYQGNNNGYSSGSDRGYNRGHMMGCNNSGGGYNKGHMMGGNRGHMMGYNNSGRGYNNSTRGYNYAPLTEAQIKKLDNIEVKYYERLSNASLEMEKQNNIIRTEMMKDSPNKGKIDTAIDKKLESQATRQKLLLEMDLAMNVVINEAKDTDK